MNITIRTSCQRQQVLSLSCKSTYHFYNTEFSFPKILLLTSKCCKFSFLNKLTTSKTKATWHLFIFRRNYMSSECKAQAEDKLHANQNYLSCYQYSYHQRIWSLVHEQNQYQVLSLSYIFLSQREVHRMHHNI